MDYLSVYMGGAITGLTPPCLYSVTLQCFHNEPHGM